MSTSDEIEQERREREERLKDDPLFRGIVVIDEEEAAEKTARAEELQKEYELKQKSVLPEEPNSVPDSFNTISGFDWEPTEDLINDPEQLEKFREWKSRMKAIEQETIELRAQANAQRKHCEMCGGGFISKREWGKYCTAECRQTAYWRRRGERKKR